MMTVQPSNPLSPTSRPAGISTLIDGVDRYNPQNCHLLEDYLKDQLTNSTYDLLSNLALLKLYQFNPALLSPSATLSILFLSLAHAPFSPDFTLAWALLSDSFVVGAALPPAQQGSDDGEDSSNPAQPEGEKETAERLQELSALLQARKFKSFWNVLRNGKGGGEEGKEEEKVKKTVIGLLKSAVGVEERLRDCIAAEVEQSFKSLARKTVESFLGLEANSAALLPLVKKHGWTLDGSVQFPTNESNSPTSTLQREKIEVAQLSRMLGKSQ